MPALFGQIAPTHVSTQGEPEARRGRHYRDWKGASLRCPDAPKIDFLDCDRRGRGGAERLRRLVPVTQLLILEQCRKLPDGELGAARDQDRFHSHHVARHAHRAALHARRNATGARRA